MHSRLVSPGWVALHVLVAVGVAAMAWLGWWQWERGVVSDSLRNYAYGLEWWAFGLFTVGAWVKYCVDEVRPEADDDVFAAAAAGAPAPVAAVIDDSDDPELAAWNRQFAERAARERR